MVENEHFRASEPQTVQVGWHPALFEKGGEACRAHVAMDLITTCRWVVLQDVLPESRECPEEWGQDHSRGTRGSSAGPRLPLRLCRSLRVQNLGHVTRRFPLI